MKINNRRKGSTFLDYQYGEVVPVDKENQYNDQIESNPAPVKEEIEIKGKTIKTKPVCIILTFLFGLFVCHYIFMHCYTCVSLTAKVFDFLGNSYITAGAYNNNYEKEKEEELAEKGSSSINIFDFEGQKEYNQKKDTAKHLMNQISTYDKYLLSYYNTLKTNINQYRSGRSSYYIMNSSLESLTNTATYDYNKLLSETFPDENVKKLFVARYKIFLSYLSSQTNSFTPSSLVTKTNEAIAEDNAYNLKEYEFLKQYLDNANISYICENNKIRVV